MKRFVWRLQRVLEVKAKEEQNKQAELLRASEQLAETRSGLLIQKRIMANIINDLAATEPRQRIGEQEFFLRHSAASNKVIAGLEKKTTELEKVQKEKIKELLKVKRFKEGLDKLREEAKIEFIAEQEKLEQKELDDAAIVRFASNLIR